MQTFKVLISFLVIYVVCACFLVMTIIGNLNITFIDLISDNDICDASSQIEVINPKTLEVSSL